MGWTPGGVAPSVCACVRRKTLVNARSMSRIRTDGRTVVLGRVRSSKKRLVSSRPTTRRTCLRPVAIAVHIVLYDRPSTAGATPPGVHPTSTSRDVSDLAFSSLSNFYPTEKHRPTTKEMQQLPTFTANWTRSAKRGGWRQWNRSISPTLADELGRPSTSGLDGQASHLLDQ